MRLLHKLVVVIILLFSQVANAWFDCNWYYRSDVVITENAGNNLVDYQVLLELNATSMHANYIWSSVGQDLRVLDTDDSTPLDYYIHSWDAVTKQAQVWVKIPSLPANSNKTIYFYHGNPAATTTSTSTIILTEPGIKFHTRN